MEKLARFARDKEMVELVRHEIENAALGEGVKDKDVHVLAAERLALDILRRAFKNIDRYRREENEKEKNIANPGI